jgi:hypothetical protein
MALNRNEVNPLSVLGVRKLSFIPEHFSKLSIDNKSDIKLLDQWINYHLNSRYALKKTFEINETKKIAETIEIGIEDPKELLMLTLGCPYVHKQ